MPKKINTEGLLYPRKRDTWWSFQFVQTKQHEKTAVLKLLSEWNSLCLGNVNAGQKACLPSHMIVYHITNYWRMPTAKTNVMQDTTDSEMHDCTQVLKELQFFQEHQCNHVFFSPSWVTPTLLHSRGSKQLITDAWLLHSCWTAGDVSDNKSQTLGGCLSPGWLLVCKWNHHSCSVRTLLEWGEKGVYGGRILMLVSGESCLPPK